MMNQLPRKEAKQIIKNHQESEEKGNAIYFWLILVVILFSLGWIGLMKLIDFSQSYEIVKNPIVQATFKWPLEIRVKEEAKVIEKIIEPATPDQVDTNIKKYACEKFGEFHCLTMIAVFQGESGWDNTKWNYNTNDTLDYGIAQINSVHWKQAGCALQDIVDEINNIDCAYKIWDRADGKEGDNQGSFSPWVVYQNGNYLAHLD